LLLAVESDRIEVVELLARNAWGGAVPERDAGGVLPLHHAAVISSVEVVGRIPHEGVSRLSSRKGWRTAAAHPCTWGPGTIPWRLSDFLVRSCTLKPFKKRTRLASLPCTTRPGEGRSRWSNALRIALAPRPGGEVYGGRLHTPLHCAAARSVRPAGRCGRRILGGEGSE
jgi:hypothetical protein